MLKVKVFLLLVALFTSITALSQVNKNKIKNNLDTLSFKIQENESQLIKIDSAIHVLSKQINQKDKQIEILQKEISNQKKQIDNTEINLLNFSKTSKLGAFFLLFGILLEVLGATLLASFSLSFKIEPIRYNKVNYSVGDFGVADKMKDNLINFYGILGSLLITLGFLFQFIGTILVIGFTIWLLILFIFIALFLSIGLIIILSGNTIGQTKKQKFKIILMNLKKLLIIPLADKILYPKKIHCEICTKHLSFDIARLGYVNPKNTSETPYLNLPHSFYYGHSECLDNKLENIEEVKTYNLKSFLKSELQELEEKLSEAHGVRKVKYGIVENNLSECDTVIIHYKRKFKSFLK